MPPVHPDLSRAVAALTDERLAPIVDLVAYRDADGADGADDLAVANDASGIAVVVANAAGAARLRPGQPAELLHGRNPVEDTDPMRFADWHDEAADPSPPNDRHAYPYPAHRLASLFADADRAPDVAVVHTARHFFPEQGGHAGEHGSLNVVQSRAPFVLSGPGAVARGVVDDHARVVDVGPTLAAAAGVPVERLRDLALDGAPRTDLVQPDAARWVVGLLWDGANAGELLHLARRGDLPNVGRLLERGLALRGGAIAEFPSLTLVNHTSALTGVGPGRHGVVGNAYVDRATGQTVVPNDSRGWHRWADWVRPGVSTAFEWVADALPDRTTACVNEPVDRGATYSTMGLIRQSGSTEGAHALDSMLPDPTASPYATRHLVADRADCAWASQVDDIGLQQVLQVWASPDEAPALLWWNTIVTDTGHHAGGPRSAPARAALADADRRLGALLDHWDRLGVTDDVTVLLTADHGFEAADPAVRGEWGSALTAAGVGFRDVGPGFVYLDPAKQAMEPR